MPLVEVIRAHVFAAERIYADDTTVPVLAKGETRIGRLWTYVRDDRPFAGPDPAAAVFFYSRDRGGEHPEQHSAGYAGLMQADAYAGFNRLYEPLTPAEFADLVAAFRRGLNDAGFVEGQNVRLSSAGRRSI
jgi:transposase